MPEESVLTNRSVDLVTYTILINGSEIPDTYQVRSLMVCKEINKIPMAKLLLFDGTMARQDFETSNADDFIPGNEIEIKAGYHSEEESLFRGIIIKHGIKIRKGTQSVLEIECRDSAIKLTGGRHSACFVKVKDSDIISEIISKYSLEADVEDTSVEHPEIVQFNCTDWDFLVTRAEVNGLLVITDDGKISVKPPDSGQDPSLTLTYGSTIIEFEAEMDARFQVSQVSSHSWDYLNQELLESEASPPSYEGPGNITVGELAEVIHSNPYKMYHGGSLEMDELKAWADAKLLKSHLAKIRGRVRFTGYAGIKPGNIVTLEGVGERFNGDAFVSAVTHQIYGGKWITDIELGMSPHWFTKNEDIIDTPASGLVPSVHGLHIGKVVQIGGDEIDGHHRILVKIPFVEQDGGTDAMGVWARLSSVFAGENRGMVFRPEIDDEVVIGYVNGDPRDPVILGALHSSVNPAPIESNDDNFEKGIYTKGEMKITFDDEKKIVLIETKSGNSVKLSEEDGEIAVADENGNSITLNSDGITLESASDLILKASGDIKVEGTNVEQAASANLKVEGSAGAEISSGGQTVVKGSMVQIN